VTQHNRPQVEFVDWRDSGAARNAKVIDVSTDEGAVCRLTLAATDTGLDIRATEPHGTVRIGNGAHWLPVHRDGDPLTVDYVTPRPVGQAAPTYAISLTEDTEDTRPDYRRYRVSSPAGAFVMVVQMNGKQDELTVALIDADSSVTATIGYVEHTTEWPHPVSAVERVERVAAPGDTWDRTRPSEITKPEFDELVEAEKTTSDVPDDYRLLRVALAHARQAAAPQDAQAYVLFDGLAEQAADSDVNPVSVVIGTRVQAGEEANQRNLATLHSEGALTRTAVVHVSEAVPFTVPFTTGGRS